jgi:hypothetical protein
MLDRLHWLWLALAAPFLLFPSPKRSLAMLVVPALWVLHWIVVRKQWAEGSHLRGYNAEIRDKRKADGNEQTPIALTPLNGALLLMILMVLVSLWVTFDINYSLPKISGMVLGMGVFFAIVREGQRPRGWLLSLLVFLCTGIGIGIVGLFGTAWFESKITFVNPVIARLPRLISGLPGAESGIHPNALRAADALPAAWQSHFRQAKS